MLKKTLQYIKSILIRSLLTYSCLSLFIINLFKLNYKSKLTYLRIIDYHKLLKKKNYELFNIQYNYQC
jgi:hypothetical protein